MRKSGSALLLGGAFSCTEFRSDESSNPKAAGDFAKVKRELATAKDAYATAVAGDHPKYEKPNLVQISSESRPNLGRISTKLDE